LLKRRHPELRLLGVGNEAELRATRHRDRGAGLESLRSRHDQENHAGPQDKSPRNRGGGEMLQNCSFEGDVDRPIIRVYLTWIATPAHSAPRVGGGTFSPSSPLLTRASSPWHFTSGVCPRKAALLQLFVGASAASDLSSATLQLSTDDSIRRCGGMGEAGLLSNGGPVGRPRPRRAI
jgi:hypothetical protein